MKNEKNLRDELAMSLNHNSIPKIENEEALISVCSEFNLNRDGKKAKGQIEFALKYEAKIRYMYADAMLNERKKGNKPD